jgi:hypothetical protein
LRQLFGCQVLRLGVDRFRRRVSNKPEEFADMIRAEAPYWARLIKDARIKQIE